MLKSIIPLTIVGTVVAGCTENPRAKSDSTAGPVVRPAAPEVNVFEGAAVGAPIVGLAGAVWADPNNTGYVTGYTLNGKYYPGAPTGYDPSRHAVVPPH